MKGALANAIAMSPGPESIREVEYIIFEVHQSIFHAFFSVFSHVSLYNGNTQDVGFCELRWRLWWTREENKPFLKTFEVQKDREGKI